jgi:hypothetical protein
MPVARSPASTPSISSRFAPQISSRCSFASASNGQLRNRIVPPSAWYGWAAGPPPRPRADGLPECERGASERRSRRRARGDRAGEEMGDQRVAALGQRQVDLVRGAPVELIRPAGARAAAPREPTVSNVEETCIGELVEMERREAALDPYGPSGLIAADLAAIAQDIEVQGATDGLRQEGGGLKFLVGDPVQRAGSLTPTSVSTRAGAECSPHTADALARRGVERMRRTAAAIPVGERGRPSLEVPRAKPADRADREPEQERRLRGVDLAGDEPREHEDPSVLHCGPSLLSPSARSESQSNFSGQSLGAITGAVRNLDTHHQIASSLVSIPSTNASSSRANAQQPKVHARRHGPHPRRGGRARELHPRPALHCLRPRSGP